MEENTKKVSAFRGFLNKKGITLSPKVYFIDAMGSMALGLFASLLIGTIFATVAGWLPDGSWIAGFFGNMSTYAKQATGAVLGIAIAYSLKAHPLVIFSAGAVGMIGNGLPSTFSWIFKVVDGENILIPITAGPLGAFICVLIAVEVGKLVSKSTKVDILVTPTVTIGTGVALAMLTSPGISLLMYWLGEFIEMATNALPFFIKEKS